MARTAARPIEFRRGDDYAHKIILPAVDEFDAAIDWSGASFAAQIRSDADADDVLASFAIDDAHLAEDPPYVMLSLDASVTADLPISSVWDFEETRNGRPRTPLGGPVACYRDVTR